MSVWREIFKRFSRKFFVNILTVLLPIVLVPLAISPHKESRCAYVIGIVAVYWVLEPVHIGVTGLLPIVLFPLLGVVSSAEICQNYMKESFMIFIGSAIVAIAMEDCRLHERITLKVLLVVGTEIKWLMLGLMLTTTCFSMWMSNMATTLMMIPIVNAIYDKIGVTFNTSSDIPLEESCSLTESKHVYDLDDEVKSVRKGNSHCNERPSSLKVALLLSICYSANIGGTGTLTGTAPNIVLKGILEDFYPDSQEITFATWMMYNVPGMITCVLIGWFYLYLVYLRFSKVKDNLALKEEIRRIISERYKKLGSLRFDEIAVMTLLLVLVCLWLLRDPKFINGWAQEWGTELKIGDSVPAMIVSFLLFFLPSDLRNLEGRPILEWKTAKDKLPWGLMFVIGGGFSLANGIKKSGLSELIGLKLSSIAILPTGAILTVICIVTAMITELVSNTTTATILLPVVNEMAISLGVNPLHLLLPVTITCSYAFMLPAATPTNAIVFEEGNLRTMDMVKPGIVMNLVCCSVQLFMISTLGVVMFDLNTLPSWAQQSESLAIFPNATHRNVTVLENVLTNVTQYFR